jgi:hypothetical protein
MQDKVHMVYNITYLTGTFMSPWKNEMVMATPYSRQTRLHLWNANKRHTLRTYSQSDIGQRIIFDHMGTPNAVCIPLGISGGLFFENLKAGQDAVDEICHYALYLEPKHRQK